jgi:hypothetical protein
LSSLPTFLSPLSTDVSAAVAICLLALAAAVAQHAANVSADQTRPYEVIECLPSNSVRFTQHVEVLVAVNNDAGIVRVAVGTAPAGSLTGRS